jgi:hypothetical protein
MSTRDSTILPRILDLYEERALLWALPWRSREVRARLAEIAIALEYLWNKRRLEKAGLDPNGMPEVIVYPRDNRLGPRFAYRHGRRQARER